MQAGEYGVLLRLETSYDLTGHTAVSLRIRAPREFGGGSIDVEPQVADEAGGILEYLTVEGDFPEDVPGIYTLQVRAQFGPNLRLISDPLPLPLKATLRPPALVS